MNRTLVVVASLLALVFLVIAYVYFTHEAQNLPHFFPGYAAGDAKHHTKHGLAALILAVGCGIYAWFKSAPSASPAKQG